MDDTYKKHKKTNWLGFVICLLAIGGLMLILGSEGSTASAPTPTPSAIAPIPQQTTADTTATDNTDVDQSDTTSTDSSNDYTPYIDSLQNESGTDINNDTSATATDNSSDTTNTDQTTSDTGTTN